MARDEAYKRLMNSRRWRYLRAAVLSERPLCERCRREGRTSLAVEVHHRTPIQWARGLADKRRLAYSPANLESLCHECHVRTHTEMGRRDAASERRRIERETSDFLRRFYGEEKE